MRSFMGLENKLITKVYSYDVFDTVVTRITAEPTGIFGLIQQKLIQEKYKISLPDYVKNNYAEVRINAEKSAREATNREEITIHQIYDIIAIKYNITREIIQKLLNIEIKEEIDSIYGVPKVITQINDLRLSGARIIFISDTYLPTQTILDMLTKVKAYEKCDHVYTSSEIGLTKASGNLFRHVLKNEICEPKQLFHLGDNLNSDIKVGRKIGVSVEYFSDTKLNMYEKTLLGDEQNRYCDLQGQLTAGISRISRLSKTLPKTDRDSALYDLGANLAGPMLVPYVKWVLLSSLNKGLKKLYFISRDGQVLLEIARIIYKNSSCSDIELRYLCGSRQAWHISSVFEIDDKELEWILLRDTDLSIEVVANRIGIDCYEFIEKLNEISNKSWCASSVLNASEIQILKKLIPQNPIKYLILNEAEKRRSLIVDYLKQEEFLDDSTSGIVDIGWHGNIQRSLKRIVNSYCKENKLVGWYFALVKNNCEEENEMYSFFFDPNDLSKARYPENSFYNFIEMFTTGDHGMTMSYERNSDGSISPVLKEQMNSNLTSWGLTSLREGILTYADLHTRYLNGIVTFDFNNYHKRILKCIEILTYKPTKSEAEALGSYLFTSDQSENKLLQFAPEFSFMNFIRLRMNGGHFSTYWIEGTSLRSKKFSSIVLFLLTRRFDLLLLKLQNYR